MLTHEERQYLKRAISDVRRLQAHREARMFPTCSKCHGEFTSWTLGCHTCRDRHTRWYREGRHPDPAYYRRRQVEADEHSEAERVKKLRGKVYGERKNPARPGQHQRPRLITRAQRAGA